MAFINLFDMQELDTMTIETFIRERTTYAALSDTFSAAMNSILGCDSAQCSMLFLLAYANCKIRNTK